jgi:hypothetical protein
MMAGIALPTPEDSRMKCPHCQVTLHMTHRDGIEIDYCPDCRGVWLDRGELDKIIERSEGWGGSGSADREPERRREDRDDRRDRDDRDSRDDRDYRDDPRSGGKPQKKKRSSFVGELFENFGDFGG